MKTIFVVCQHGNEQLPLKILRDKKKFKYIIANPKAVEKNKRFIESDLNRSFPGDIRGKSYEERLAKKLLTKIKNYDEVIDLHTATCQTPIFAILTKITPHHLEIVKKMGIKRVVYMKKSIAFGKALIDHVKCGVSIECGNEKSQKTKKDIEKILDNFSKEKRSHKKLEIYAVYKILKKTKYRTKLPKNIKNFRQVVLDGENFFPILAREKNYPNTLCLMAKKMH